MTFDINRAWEPKKKSFVRRYLGDLILVIVVVSATAVLAVGALDAFEFEKTGKCEGCVLLGDYFEGRGE